MVFVYDFLPNSYNQVDVNPKTFKVVTIPAGIAEFSGDILWGGSRPNIGYYSPVAGSTAHHINYIFEAKSAVFSYNLEAGKDYWAFVGPAQDGEVIPVFALDTQDLDKPVHWGIYLFDYPANKPMVGNPPAEALVDFIPFDPPIVTPPFSEWPGEGIAPGVKKVWRIDDENCFAYNHY
jgi:hypothetical protein